MKQCGWCPVLLLDDYQSWYDHFAVVHDHPGSYSVRNIAGEDWDIAELAGVGGDT